MLCGNIKKTSSVVLNPTKAPSPKHTAMISPLGPTHRVLFFAQMNVIAVEMAVEVTKMAKMATLRTSSLTRSKISTRYSHFRKPKTYYCELLCICGTAGGNVRKPSLGLRCWGGAFGSTMWTMHSRKVQQRRSLRPAFLVIWSRKWNF